MLTLILDTETTSIKTDLGEELQPKAVEVGWGLFCTERLELLVTGSFLTKETPDEISKLICGIDEDLVSRMPDLCVAQSVSLLNSAALCAEAVIAHNAPFDKASTERTLILKGELEVLPWVDSLYFKHPRFGHKLKGLNETAASLGIATGAAHRALADVFTLASVMKVIPNLGEQIRRQMTCSVFKVGTNWSFTYTHFEKVKYVVQKAGFSWDPKLKYWNTEIFAKNEKEARAEVEERLQFLKDADIPYPALTILGKKDAATNL
jgi:DNA polymerase III epsilon subunit-like protein